MATMMLGSGQLTGDSSQHNSGTVVMATRHLRPSLETFAASSQTTVRDRQKALAMLRALDAEAETGKSGHQQLQQYRLKLQMRRPETAQARLGNLAILNPFATTYTEHFPIKDIIETTAERPQSTVHLIGRSEGTPDTRNQEPVVASNELSDYNGSTSYEMDFCEGERRPGTAAAAAMRTARLRGTRRTGPDRCATASGARCNNPHPHKEFLVWRFPRRSSSASLQRQQDPEESLMHMDSGLARINDAQFDRVMRGQCRSTYQVDYEAASAARDRAHKSYELTSPGLHALPRKTKSTTQRIDYTRPPSSSTEDWHKRKSLLVPTNRFGSNGLKQQSASGIIPGATNTVYMHTTTRTTYDDDVNDRAHAIHGKIVEDIQNKVDLARIHNLHDLQRTILESNNIEDRATLEKVLNKLNEPCDYKRKSFVSKPFYHSSSSLAWSSKWPGPL